ncbi:hypothetical protein JTE90_007652 [Oedothorax gibbosus]|uniref:Secreted protein n=1 Tax=Oedothorax gibbosus TaxID=931172 RepID=A0AAV6UK90_9ARAC|nr:hypothetical protein JTE90_007652 [Oedothorax gibbosus]
MFTAAATSPLYGVAIALLLRPIASPVSACCEGDCPRWGTRRGISAAYRVTSARGGWSGGGDVHSGHGEEVVGCHDGAAADGGERNDR